VTFSLKYWVRTWLYLFAFFLPVSITGAELSLGVLALTLIAITAGRFSESPVRPFPLLAPLTAFICGHVVSALSGPDPLSSLASIDWVFIAMPVTVAAMRVTGELRRPVIILVSVGAVIAVYAIAQHFLGIDLVRPEGREVIIPMEGSDGRYLSIGTFGHHLTYSHLYQFIFLFLFAFVIQHLGDRKHLHLTLPAAGVVGLSLIFSYSRGIWVAVTLSALLIVWMLRGKKWLALAVVPVALGFLALLSNGSMEERLRSMTSMEANIERQIIYQANWDAIRDHPLLGLGSGRYQGTMTPYYERYNPPDQMPRVHAHNNFLQVWLNAGVIGLLGFLWLNFAFLKEAWRSIQRGTFKRPIDRVLLAAGSGGVLAFLIGGLTQYNLSDSEVAMTYWFVMGMALRVMEEVEWSWSSP